MKKLLRGSRTDVKRHFASLTTRRIPQRHNCFLFPSSSCLKRSTVVSLQYSLSFLKECNIPTMSKSCATSVSSTAYTYHSSQAAEDAVSWMDLPDALWHEVLKYSAVKDLLQMEQVCWRFHPSQPRQCTLGHEKKHAMKVEHPWLLIHNDLWRAQCENRWKNMPRYRLTPQREDWICQHYRERFGGVHDHSLNTQDGHSYNDAQSLTDAQDHAPLATPVSPFIRFSWKKVYFWMEEELARTTLTADELESLDWYFNFTPTAGGRRKATLRQCIFRHGLLFVRIPALTISTTCARNSGLRCRRWQ